MVGLGTLLLLADETLLLLAVAANELVVLAANFSGFLSISSRNFLNKKPISYSKPFLFISVKYYTFKYSIIYSLLSFAADKSVSSAPKTPVSASSNSPNLMKSSPSSCSSMSQASLSAVMWWDKCYYNMSL